MKRKMDPHLTLWLKCEDKTQLAEVISWAHSHKMELFFITESTPYTVYFRIKGENL